MVTGVVLTELKSLWGAQAAKSNSAAGQLEKRIDLVIPPSHGTAADLKRGMAKWRAVKSADAARG
jgi:hypothetical protein